jgi:hypothetical protein
VVNDIVNALSGNGASLEWSDELLVPSQPRFAETVGGIRFFEGF